jgi:hypothetical protein
MLDRKSERKYGVKRVNWQLFLALLLKDVRVKRLFNIRVSFLAVAHFAVLSAVSSYVLGYFCN